MHFLQRFNESYKGLDYVAPRLTSLFQECLPLKIMSPISPGNFKIPQEPKVKTKECLLSLLCLESSNERSWLLRYIQRLKCLLLCPTLRLKLKPIARHLRNEFFVFQRFHPKCAFQILTLGVFQETILSSTRAFASSLLCFSSSLRRLFLSAKDEAQAIYPSRTVLDSEASEVLVRGPDDLCNGKSWQITGRYGHLVRFHQISSDFIVRFRL